MKQMNNECNPGFDEMSGDQVMFVSYSCMHIGHAYLNSGKH